MEQKGELRAQERIRFVADILTKQIALRNQIETRANIIIGFSIAISAFFLKNPSAEGMRAGVVILLGASSLAIIASLFALKPPRFLSKDLLEKSVFYHGTISDMNSQEYIQKIEEVSQSESEIIRQYSLETYNLSRYLIKYKNFFATLAIRILVVGFIVGVTILSL